MTRLACTYLTIFFLLALLVPAVCLAQSTSGTAKIAFTGNTGIFEMNPDGTGLTQTTNANDYCPAWSPDGRRIAYYRFGPSWNSSIFIMNADGSNQIEIVHNFTPTENNVIDSCPSWSPSGRQLTFSYRSNIYAVNIDGSGLITLGPGGSPNWSPDGTRIAFDAADGGIYTMDISGGNVAKLDIPVSNGCSDYFTPSWSPDGTKIAAGYYCSQGDTGLVIVSQNGGFVQRLNIFVDTVSDIVFDSPRWSPDESQLVFNATTITNDYLNVPFTDIYRLNKDGSGLTRLSAGNSEPDWQHAIPRPAALDFDGDGKTDVSVFRPSEGNWWMLKSSEGFSVVNWGTASDKLVPGDYDGDGKTDFAVYRDGQWWVVKSSGGYGFENWGTATDIPVPSDYDGDGKTDFAIFRPSEGNWWILKSNGGSAVVNWGVASDKLVPGDYDGDGKTDIAIYRNGTWWIIDSTGGYTIRDWGTDTDRPVPADYDGDGKADLAVYRGDGQWWVIKSTAGFSFTSWGLATDKPVSGDYDGDGKADTAVYRGEGEWWINGSTGAATVTSFGNSTDIPVPTRYVP